MNSNSNNLTNEKEEECSDSDSSEDSNMKSKEMNQECLGYYKMIYNRLIVTYIRICRHVYIFNILKCIYNITTINT